MTVIERIGAVLAAQPGLTAQDLVLVLKSEGLDVKKSEVNHYLYSGRDMFQREGSPPKWYLGTTIRTHQDPQSSAANGSGGKFVTVKRGPQFDTATEDLPGAPFFRVDQRGGRKVLCLNRSHQFYTSYDTIAEESARTLIDAILVAYGDSGLDASGECAIWFHLVRDLWSQRCHRALLQITNDGTIDQSA